VSVACSIYLPLPSGREAVAVTWDCDLSALTEAFSTVIRIRVIEWIGRMILNDSDIVSMSRLQQTTKAMLTVITEEFR
jgi:hypothetical protein